MVGKRNAPLFVRRRRRKGGAEVEWLEEEAGVDGDGGGGIYRLLGRSGCGNWEGSMKMGLFGRHFRECLVRAA